MAEDALTQAAEIIDQAAREEEKLLGAWRNLHDQLAVIFELSHREVHCVLDYCSRSIHEMARERNAEIDDYAKEMPVHVLWGIAGVCVGKMQIINGGLDREKGITDV